MLNLPRLFFRIKDNGASVFRVGAAGPSGRLEFTKVATVVPKVDKIKPQDKIELSEDETRLIREWAERNKVEALSDLEVDLRRLSREINLVTHNLSASSDRTDGLDAAISLLLLSLLDMRQAIAEKLAAKGGSGHALPGTNAR